MKLQNRVGKYYDIIIYRDIKVPRLLTSQRNLQYRDIACTILLLMT